MKNCCENPDAVINRDGIHSSGSTNIPVVIISLESERQIIKFNKETGIFITGHGLSKNAFTDYKGTVPNYLVGPGAN
jgi:hypothetical protein